MVEDNNIVVEASRYVFNLFKKRLSHEFVYHNYQHTFETAETCKRLVKGYPELSDLDIEILLLACWFHDTGYINTYKGHEDESKKIASEYFTSINYPSEQMVKVLECIDATKRESRPSSLVCQILCDADIISIGEESFFTKSQLLRKEWASFKIRECSDIDWARTELNFLEGSYYHSQEAQRLYGEQHQLNIQKQTTILNKLKKKRDKKNRKKEKTKAQPKRGIETMFRSIYRSHINLSSIADSKANMMISINSLIISITLTLVGAKLSLLGTSFKQNQIVIYPIITLLLTSLGAIIFAILSAKPNITKNAIKMQEIKDKEVSILFFGTYSRIPLNEFEYEMKELMKSEDILYGNMIRDLYYLGLVLTRKYNLIKISYVIFMIGLILTVLITVYVVIYLKQHDDHF